MIKVIKKYLSSRLHSHFLPLEQNYAKSTILQSLLIAESHRKKERIQCLSEVEFSGFSQWGEDGIIDWLISRLPEIPQSFIEFGVEDYRESNTRLLLCLHNWRGLVMDGSAMHIANVQAQDIYWRYNLTATCAFIDRDNINRLISDAGFNGEVGLLSVDIDGNDFWIWQAINVVNPVIVVCEYNAVLGDMRQLTVPYQADFQRTQAHHSNLYFGASLTALIQLGQDKGYSFVGTTSTGCNAFFIRNDHAARVLDSVDEVVSFPSRFRESRNVEGHLTFVAGIERQKIIQDLPLIDLETNRPTTLAECEDIYSSGWRNILDR